MNHALPMSAFDAAKFKKVIFDQLLVEAEKSGVEDPASFAESVHTNLVTISVRPGFWAKIVDFLSWIFGSVVGFCTGREKLSVQFEERYGRASPKKQATFKYFSARAELLARIDTLMGVTDSLDLLQKYHSPSQAAWTKESSSALRTFFKSSATLFICLFRHCPISLGFRAFETPS